MQARPWKGSGIGSRTAEPQVDKPARLRVEHLEEAFVSTSRGRVSLGGYQLGLASN